MIVWSVIWMNDYDDETEKALEYYRSHRKWLEFKEYVKDILITIIITAPLLWIVIAFTAVWYETGQLEFWHGLLLGGTYMTIFMSALNELHE